MSKKRKKRKKQKGPKKQHFVPKCYLSEFVDPNTPIGQEPYIWVFTKDGKSRKNKAPVNLFTENHLYTIKFEGEKNFSIEQNLSKIEGKFANIMREIKKKKPLSDHDHAHLCIFIAAQLQRTLRFKKNQEDFIQQLIDHGTQISLAHGVTDSKQVKEWFEYKKDIHKLQLMESLPFLSNILKQMNIAFLCSPDILKHPFISSDDPCVLFNPDLQWQKFYGPGFGQKNVQLTLPLSPEITVMFTWVNYHGYGLLPSSSVENLNRMTRSHCDKEFISSQKQTKWIWFSRVPFDLFFILKIIKNETKTFFRKIKNKWKYKKIYAKSKK
ncbi:MAG: DUF4238 domain-containing protein [Candidatus Pacebacteria bacterium]|nr:DUF4238 domain-containing protein [Candidatus Paceibacterota bacterium]